VGLCFGSDGGLGRSEGSWGMASTGVVGGCGRLSTRRSSLPCWRMATIPVISSVAAKPPGSSPHNINADTVAGDSPPPSRPEELSAHRIPLNPCGPSRRSWFAAAQLSLSEARSLIASGVVDGGMTPKNECCHPCPRPRGSGGCPYRRWPRSHTPLLLGSVHRMPAIGTMVVGPVWRRSAPAGH